MTDRVCALAKRARVEDLYEPSVVPSFDPLDMALPEPVFNAKRIMEYVLAQPVYLTEDNRFTGMFRTFTNVGVPADVFARTGHRHFSEACGAFYNHYQENLVVFEWQHSAPNYQYIVENGIEGSLQKIDWYKEQYKYDQDRYEYLLSVEHVCRKALEWSEVCAAAHEAAAKSCENPQRKAELLKLAEICRRVPRKKAESFYEGLQSIMFCFQFLPDSVGTIDRTLYSLYCHDLEKEVLTREQAKELIGEFFVHLYII